MNDWLQSVGASVAPRVPDIALSIAILVGGWLFAIIARSATFGGLKRTSFDDRIASALGIDTGNHRVERLASKIVYYFVLALVLVAFFERLKVPAVTQPIVVALGGISSALPGILKALLIAFVGYIVASLARRAVVALFERTKVLDRIEKWSGAEESAEESTAAKTIGDVVFYVILVFTAVPVVEALKIGALAEPLQAFLQVLSTYLPKVIGAAILALVGYVLGRAARAAIIAVVDRTGIHRALTRLGIGGALGRQTVGGILGNLAMVFIFLNFAISAVGRLDIEEISGPLGLILQRIYAFLPNLLVAAVLIALGVALARIAARFTRGALAAIGFNSLMVHIGLFKSLSEDAAQQEEKSKEAMAARGDGEASGDDVDPMLADASGFRTPADIGGVIVGALILLLFVRQGLETMGLASLAQMFDSLLGYVPNVLVAAVVVGVGMWAGGWAQQRLREIVGDTEDALLRALPTIVRVAIVAVAAMVALQQLGVGNQLIAIAFTLVLGAVALAFALAFGLGGRDVAGKVLDQQYRKRSTKSATRKPIGRP
ncbi:MAG: mechanosensitive ion channel [Myxococcota bacterium]